MTRCSNPDHPHCTVRVIPGDSACAHGHPQPAATPDLPVQTLPIETPPAATPGAPVAAAAALARPQLHVSGFDPRAAGGRQVLKLELRGMPADCAPQLALLASSRLRLEGGERHGFTRTARGDWLPVFLEFSSRNLEHGQYRIELALHSRPGAGGPARSWIATLLILAPRADASLHDIHQTFLATHKNVRISADDASIARVQGRLGGAGRVDIDVSARNAGIAHLDLDTRGGKIDLGVPSIAWDEDLLEIDVPAAAPRHPCPASMACLVEDGPGPRHLRLFALDECVLGRMEPGAGADLLLAHHDAGGAQQEGLTRRLSARHALIRRARGGYEIEDVSRFGLLVDGVWPGRHTPVALRAGMRIELTASIPGVVVLEVAAVLENGIVLHRTDAGREHESFWLLEPERGLDGEPCAQAGGLPALFHRDGGFWRRDPVTGLETPLTPALPLGWSGTAQFTAQPYPELRQGASARPAYELAGA